MSDAAAEAIRRFTTRPGPVRLEGTIQDYAWGGYEFLADLVGLDRGDRRPRAELWTGAHPAAPAHVVIDDVRVPLDQVVAAAPEALLGRETVRRFGPQLPYLLKVLDVRAMLSIQAHPTRDQAARGFAREEAAGVPRSAPHRNYRDRNHKPEAQVALTEFWLLSGFRPFDEIVDALARRPELRDLQVVAEGLGASAGPTALRGFYERVMSLGQAQVDAMIGPLVERLAPGFDRGEIGQGSPDHWVVRASREFALPGGRHDRGLLSIYLLNLVRLAPGEGTFLGPGVLHAYLSGAAVEIMASSDNVLRGGLTPKHVDVAELLRILTFEPTAPVVTGGIRASFLEYDYPAPAEEFRLTRLELTAGARVARAPASAETLLVVSGTVELSSGTGTMRLARGALALVPAGTDYALTCAGAPASVFRGAVGT